MLYDPDMSRHHRHLPRRPRVYERCEMFTSVAVGYRAEVRVHRYHGEEFEGSVGYCGIYQGGV